MQSLILRLHAWSRRETLRIGIALLFLVLAAFALGLRYRQYLIAPTVPPIPPGQRGATHWFRPIGDGLEPIESQEASPGDMEIEYFQLQEARTGRGQRDAETLQLVVKVLNVQPPEAAAEALRNGHDLTLELARLFWYRDDLTPEVRRSDVDPGVVVLRYRNRAYLRTNALRHMGQWTPPVLVMLLVAIGVSEGLAWMGRRLVPPGHCYGCGYPMEGLPGAICPECGRAV